MSNYLLSIIIIQIVFKMPLETQGICPNGKPTKQLRRCEVFEDCVTDSEANWCDLDYKICCREGPGKKDELYYGCPFVGIPYNNEGTCAENECRHGNMYKNYYCPKITYAGNRQFLVEKSFKSYTKCSIDEPLPRHFKNVFCEKGRIRTIGLLKNDGSPSIVTKNWCRISKDCGSIGRYRSVCVRVSPMIQKCFIHPKHKEKPEKSIDYLLASMYLSYSSIVCAFFTIIFGCFSKNSEERKNESVETGTAESAELLANQK